ncbi:MAG: tRNA lysidine(34) synthetase TilS [bacterium]
MNTIYNCIVCSKQLVGKQRSFCSIDCKNDHYLNYSEVKRRAEKTKRLLVSNLGGKCSQCGYNTSLSALSFYNKKGETLRINTNQLANNNYEKLAQKIKNAQILCKNCMEETTNPAESHTQVMPSSSDRCPSTEAITLEFSKNLVICGVKPEQTIILGVSGGVDSMTMLDLFAKSELATRFNLVVAHLNHGVRKEAKSDESFVKKIAEKYGYKFVSKSIKRPDGGNLEEKLRDERRRFLLDTANNNGVSLQGPTLLSLAHNANDQAETFIMNLARGSGPAGLGAMNMQDDIIIRPLLNITRENIASYARLNKLKWHEDKTNLDTTYARNYIRHNILPLFYRLNPEYLANIYRSAEIQRDTDKYIKQQAANQIANKSLPRPVLFEIFGRMYEEVRGDRQNLSLANLVALGKLIENNNGTKSINLPGGIVATRTYDKLDFCAEKEHNNTSTQAEVALKEINTFNNGFKVEFERYIGSRLSNYSLLTTEDLLGKMVVRPPKNGDKIAKRGIAGNKKLQDLFVDAKIDRVRRQQWPVVTIDEDIIWVPGLAISRLVPENPEKPILIKVSEVTNEKRQQKNK